MTVWEASEHYNLLLSVLSVAIVHVTVTNHTPGAYISTPPILVNWGDMGISVVYNESSSLPGLYDHHGPAQPAEEGKEIINYTVEIKGILLVWVMEFIV